MPSPLSYFTVSDQPRVGDAVFDLRQAMGAPQDPPIVVLARRVRQLELRVIALETRMPAARWQRFVARWQTRRRKLLRWIRSQTRQLWARVSWR